MIGPILHVGLTEFQPHRL